MIEEIDKGGLVYGGRFDQINNIMDYFFAEIKKCKANLVFFARLDEGKYKDIGMFAPINGCYDCISQRKCLNSYLNRNQSKNSSTLYPNERIWYNLQQIAAKYGKLYVNYGLSKQAILAYAKEKRGEVMAIMTRNTEFLVHSCDFEYWSLSDVDFNTLKIAKFCRWKLDQTLDFNQHQMQLLFVISEFEPADKYKLIGRGGNPFVELLKYVARQRCGRNGYVLSELTGNIGNAKLKEIETKISDLEALNKFKGSFNEDITNGFITELVDADIIFDMVLQFCQMNIPFAYKLINETMSVPKDLLFIDVRRDKSADMYIDLVIKVTMKMVGISFKDIKPEKRPKQRAVKVKKSISAAVQMDKDVIYPPSK